MTRAAIAQKAQNATITTPSEREIRIERICNAPRERVWKALTDPALVRVHGENSTGCSDMGSTTSETETQACNQVSSLLFWR